MGIPEVLSIALDAVARAILGVLAVAKGKNEVVRMLGLAWLLLSVMDLVLLARPDWTRFADYAPYAIFGGAMLYVGWWQRRTTATPS